MTTYPIYKAHYGGSSDCMCGTTIMVAAINLEHAKELLVAKQGRQFNNINTGIGSIVKTEDHSILYADEDAILKVIDIRATRCDWSDTTSGKFV